MDFALSAKAEDVCGRMWDFMREHVFPAEPVYEEWRAARGHDDHDTPPVLEELKAEARKRGLWNLFLHELAGLSNLEYASVAEITGWSPVIAPEAINCEAPDTGNMETLMLFGTPEQKERWLNPLLEGEIRSAFAMTEPDVAVLRRPQHPDVDRPRRRRLRHQRPQVVDHRRRRPALPDLHRDGQDRPRRRRRTGSSRWSSCRGTPPGFEIVRHLPVFGYQDQHGHSELRFADVRVPASNLLAGEGDGFMIAQARLGPGRIHHCMRAIGMAERALALMVERAKSRVAFGQPLAEQGVVREPIAQSRIEIDQARLYVLKTAGLIDKFGAKGARTEISAIKVAAPKVALDVIDRAIEVHGGAGVSDDTPLAELLRPGPHAADRRRPRRGAHPRGRQGGAGPGAPLQRLIRRRGLTSQGRR